MARAALVFILAAGAVGSAIGFEFHFVSSLIQKASSFIDYQRTEQSSTEDPNLNHNFDCLKDGLYRNPEECESYIQCSNGLAYTHPCPNSLHFSNETQNCESPCYAQCDPTIACECGWETCRDLKSSGKLPPWVPPYIPPAEKGPCHGNFQRYYCDAETQTCKPFTYGGCQGNDNNFEDEESCSLACRFPSEKASRRARTFLPPDWIPPFIPPAEKGPCEGNFQRYYCDAETQTCKTFTYGGCKGNDNNFEDEEDCSLACRFPSDNKNDNEQYSTENAQSVQFKCTEGDRYPDFDNNCNQFIECSNGRMIGMRCPENLHFDRETKKCVTPCKAYCDPSIAERCEWIPYDPDWWSPAVIGKGADHTDDHDDVCSLPYEKGPCFAYIPRFFFDRTKRTCQRFMYGGCGGNANNFKTVEECERRCLLQEDSQLSYSTISSTQTDEFTCIKDGLYHNSEDCTSYIKCSNGDPSVMPCPEGLHFSKETKRCENPCDARCDLTIAEECGRYKLVKDTFDPICTQRWDFGTCGLYIHRFFFDTVTWRCRRFLYSGCDGNTNNFRSLEECRRQCRPPKNSQSRYVTKYSTKDDEITCIEDGMYSNPEDCTSYIQCSNGNPNTIPCPEGFHFSKNTERCESPCDARCDLTIADECGWNKISENSKTPFHSTILHVPDDCDFNFKHDQSICQSFDDWKNTAARICLNWKMPLLYGSSELLPCGPNLFSGIEFVCCPERVLQKEQISTEDSHSTFSETEMFTDITEIYRTNQLSTDYSSTVQLPCNTDGLYPDPEDCNRFIQCSNDQTYPMPCPYGLHFSEVTQKCEIPCDARCNMTLACQCGWPECSDLEVDCEAEPSVGPCRTSTNRYYYDRDSGKCRRFTYGGCGGNTNNFISERECKQKCQQKLLEGYRCPSPNGKFADFFDCISYYDCKRGNPTLKRCPRGKAFDHLKSKCVSEDEATCLYKCRDQNAAYYYTLDCHKYIDCVNGISKVERCPYGEAFDRRTKQCVDEKAIGCTRS